MTLGTKFEQVLQSCQFLLPGHVRSLLVAGAHDVVYCGLNLLPLHLFNFNGGIFLLSGLLFSRF